MIRRIGGRVLFGTALVLVAILSVAVVVALFVRTRPAYIRGRVARAVGGELHLEAAIGGLEVRFRPHASLVATDVTLRTPGRSDMPPFVAIDRLSVEANPFRLASEILRGHVHVVHVEGLRITSPPSSPADPPAPPLLEDASKRRGVIADDFVADDATLTILHSDPAHQPLVFRIHDLELRDLAFDRAIPYRADLSNPIPTGEVHAEGSVGPWQSSPSDLPLEGSYTFRHADLDTIAGIGGLLTSDGSYTGTLGCLRVEGKTNTPNFNLDMGGRAVPLATTFTAVVNGSNGTTHLESVDATLFRTTVHVTGDIVNLPGPTGFDISLAANVAHGHIEDVLALVMDASKPPLTGDVRVNATVQVPAGDSPVHDRLAIDAAFALTTARFTDGEVEKKIETLSWRGRGQDADSPMSRVATNVNGRLHLAANRIAFPALAFEVPGAAVVLKGSYAVRSSAMDFEGQLRTQASLSDVVGGFKSIFIKPLDWLFRRDGAGAVIPIRIEGTRDHPRFGVRIGAALTRGK